MRHNTRVHREFMRVVEGLLRTRARAMDLREIIDVLLYDEWGTLTRGEPSSMDRRVDRALVWLVQHGRISRTPLDHDTDQGEHFKNQFVYGTHDVIRRYRKRTHYTTPELLGIFVGLGNLPVVADGAMSNRGRARRARGKSAA